MIERAVGCLENRGFHLSYAAHGIPLRSCRRLHSAFWSHGAGSIDLPSWWIALLQLPQAKEASKIIQKDIKTRFLDFLYPSQALTFIRKDTGTGSAVVRQHRQIVTAHQRSRAYASLPTDASLHPSCPAIPYEAKESPQQSADEEISRDKREEDPRKQLDNLLSDADGKANLSGLWKTYLEIQSLALTLNPQQILEFLRCLAKSGSKVNQQRLLQVFGSLPITERKSIHYSYAITAALNCGKIEAAVRLHSEALLGTHVSIGTSSLLAYTVQQRFWQVAVETWQAYWSHKEGSIQGSDIWVGIDTIPLPELWDSALSAIDFATNLTELADSGVAAAARGFALQLALRSFAVRNTKGDSVHDARHLKPSVVGLEYPNADKQRQLFEKALSLQAPTYELYESAILQALSFETRPYDAQALRFYQALRANAHITPAPDMLEALLRQSCKSRSRAGILLILDDFRFYHKTLSKRMFQLAVTGLAIQGHHTAIEILLKEYVLLHGKIVSSYIANSILEAHKRRGEVKTVVETFKSLEGCYGFKPDGTSYNTVVSTHARVGDAEGASTWYNRLLDSGFMPTQHTLVSLMAMFAKRGDLEEVEKLLRQSELTYGYETGTAMINVLVSAHLKSEKLAEAERLVNRVLETAETVPRQSLTRMWNYLLHAFAMRGDLQKVASLHQRMRANNIPSDALTFAALMQGFSIARRPGAAYKILNDIMPRLGIKATSVHYAICMGSFFKIKEYVKIFVLYSRMLENGIKPDLSVHNYLIRAAAGFDNRKGSKSTTGSDQPKYEIAREAFEQAVKDLDPTDLATTDLIQFVGETRLDEFFTSSYFSYLIFLHGKEKATDYVKIIYDKYQQTKSDLNMDVESTPPIKMLSALMAADLEEGNHDALDHYWDLCLQRARKLACRAGAEHSERGWVLPARRFILNIHLRHYMRSLIDRSKYDEIGKVIEHLHHCGFELDSRSWNFYVRTLLRSNNMLLAFETCEKELMPGWLGWEPRMDRQVRGSLNSRQPKHLEPHRRMPDYRTLVYLVAAFVDARSSLGAEGDIPSSQQLYNVAPKSVDAATSLPHIFDKIQEKWLARR